MFSQQFPQIIAVSAYGADRWSGAKPWFHYWWEKKLAATSNVQSRTKHGSIDPSLQVVQTQPACGRFGFAAKYLFTKPPFANLPFAACTSALLGQIERDHYWFVVDSSNDIQGYLGWGLTTEEKAESWLQGGRDPDGEESKVRDCIVISVYAANSSKAHRYLWDRTREIMKGKRIVYFKRQYKDGRLRPGRLIDSAVISNHIERNASA